MPKKRSRQSGQKNKGSKWVIAVAALFTVLIGIFLLARYGGKVYEPPIPQKADIEETKRVSLYFSDENAKKLDIEKRDIKKGKIEAEMRETVEELIKGPAGKMVRTIPEDTRLLNIMINGDAASLDFSKEIKESHPGGSSAEIQTVYSIVNTITSNFHEIKKVQILINGKKEKTLAGHIDISLPLHGDKTR